MNEKESREKNYENYKKRRYTVKLNLHDQSHSKQNKIAGFSSTRLITKEKHFIMNLVAVQIKYVSLFNITFVVFS